MRRACAWPSALGLAVVTMLSSAPAAALLSAPRYAVCQFEKRPLEVPSNRRQALPRRKPRVLTGVDLVVIDVAEVAPLPSRGLGEPRPLVAQTGLDFRCVGLPKAERAIREVIAAPPGTRWRGHDAADWRALHLRAAGAFALKGTRATIRRELQRPLPAGKLSSRHFDAFRVKLAAAHAAADLADDAAAPLVLEFLRQREGQSAPIVWEEGLTALRRLDPVLAQSYAVALLGRLGDASERRAHPNMLRHALELIDRRDPDALAALRELSARLPGSDEKPAGRDGCLLLAARVRAGDDALAKWLRPELARDLRSQRSVACYGDLIDLLFPGHVPEEVPVLTHRSRYDGILRLIERMASSPVPTWPQRRRELMAWLKKQAKSPRISGGRRHREYQPSTRARHLTAQAALGDEAARLALVELIRDPEEDGATPFLAARLGLRFRLAGMADAAAGRMREAIARHHDHLGRDPWTHRGRLVVTEHVRLMEAMRASGDPRFALALLDRQVHARTAAAFALAGFGGDRGAVCRAVLRAAVGDAASNEAIDHGLWALSTYGRTCLAEAQRAARGSSRARGMGLELLAMLHRLPSLPRGGARWPPRVSAARKRALVIQAVPWVPTRQKERVLPAD